MEEPEIIIRYIWDERMCSWINYEEEYFIILGTHLDRLNKCVEQDPDADWAPQQLDQPSRTEQPQEANLNNAGGINNASCHCDEIKRVPRVFEITLNVEKRY